MNHTHNSILARLDERTSKSVTSHLRLVHLEAGQILAEPFERVRAIYFPLSAVASFMVELSSGRMIEAGMVGRDGVIGAEEALHDTPAFSQVVVQVPGKALVLAAYEFSVLHAEYEALRNELAIYRRMFMAQVQQTAACNSSHYVEARLCRWLLRLRDLAGGEFSTTQELIAQMLGVQRASVSVEAKKLQDAGLISYRRGRIKITDPNRLRNAACECYGHTKKYEHAVLGSNELEVA